MAETNNPSFFPSSSHPSSMPTGVPSGNPTFISNSTYSSEGDTVDNAIIIGLSIAASIIILSLIGIVIYTYRNVICNKGIEEAASNFTPAIAANTALQLANIPSSFSMDSQEFYTPEQGEGSLIGRFSIDEGGSNI